jgi:hypothetical protein
MSEAVLKQAPVLERPSKEAVAELLPPVVPAEHNDNATVTELLAGERRNFEIPSRIWVAMVAFYGVFFAAMFAAIGGGYATFVLVVSLFFVAMFFGTPRIMLKQGPPQPRSPLDGPSRSLPTLNGAIGQPEVAVQMLIVPACAAFLGLAVLVIRLLVE